MRKINNNKKNYNIMEQNLNLYLVKTKAFRAYVVAETTDDAWNKFKTWLEANDGYGFINDRNLDSITVVASMSAYRPLSSGGTNWDDRNVYDMLFL